MQGSEVTRPIISLIDNLKTQVAVDRCLHVKKKMEENSLKAAELCNNHYELSTERRHYKSTDTAKSLDLLTKKQKDAQQHGIGLINEDVDTINFQDDGDATPVILLESSIVVRNAVKLPEFKRLPPYRTWIFVDRNQRMTDDQSVVGRKRIYYDQDSGEALICSDSEDEEIEVVEKKRKFEASEDYIIRMTIKEFGVSETVLGLLAQSLSRKSCEVKARYEVLVDTQSTMEKSKTEDAEGTTNLSLYKDLDAALDTFDHLFCRRCYVFDCKSHECSQDLIFPVEKQLPWSCTSDENVPCGSHCYLLEEFVDENIYQQDLGAKSWKAMDKSLLKKGIEIFGRNSCLIVRNVMPGTKTCTEVFQYMNLMNYSEYKLTSQTGDGATNSVVEGKVDCNETVADGVRRRSKFLRRKGKLRRSKFTWKAAGYHSMRKRISVRKDELYKQYNPCGCQSACGKQCPCLVNETCCEKYCGCPKSCKKRFRGCHCAKSQCQSRQCPCFAAGRECDPDVCRNCWVSCGDGTLGVPNQRGDNSECRNMKLLRKQKQKVLLGRSEIAGWGVFLKNSVCKDEYLGEYTGEMISHREAELRGKVYDRENCSYLFDLNDEFVLDAYRMGDKLKFANHSPKPNCYAKILMVGGDHRVGIFAKQRIGAGEEIFYDYRYNPACTPDWAKKLEASDDTKKHHHGASSSGRAKKLPSL